MERIRASIEVAASAATVWPLLAEFRYWPEWGPTVRAVESEAREVAPGVQGRLQTVARVWLSFEITSVEPLHSWDWKVAGIPATGHHLVALGPDRCSVEFTAPRLVAPYVVVLRKGLQRIKNMAEAVGPSFEPT